MTTIRDFVDRRSIVRTIWGDPDLVLLIFAGSAAEFALNRAVDWRVGRRAHIVRDLSYSKHTSMLFRQYRKHLGWWRYQLLLEVQAVLVPGEVRRLLQFNSNRIMSGLVQTYGIINRRNLRSLVHGLLIPPRYWSEVRSFVRN